MRTCMPCGRSRMRPRRWPSRTVGCSTRMPRCAPRCGCGTPSSGAFELSATDAGAAFAGWRCLIQGVQAWNRSRRRSGLHPTTAAAYRAGVDRRRRRRRGDHAVGHLAHRRHGERAHPARAGRREFLAFSAGEFSSGSKHDAMIEFVNAGVGPAKVDSVEMFYRGQPVTSVLTLLQQCCGLSTDAATMHQQLAGAISLSSSSDFVLRPAEHQTIMRLAYDANAARTCGRASWPDERHHLPGLLLLGAGRMLAVDAAGLASAPHQDLSEARIPAARRADAGNAQGLANPDRPARSRAAAHAPRPSRRAP